MLLAKTEVLGPEAFVLGHVSASHVAEEDGALAGIRLPSAGLSDERRGEVRTALEAIGFFEWNTDATLSAEGGEAW